MKTYIFIFFIFSFIAANLTAQKLSPEARRHLEQKGDLLAKHDALLQLGIGPPTQMPKSVINPDISALREFGSPVFKQIKVFYGDLLHNYNQILEELFAYGKIHPGSTVFDTKHVLAADLLEIAREQNVFAREFANITQISSALLLSAEAAGLPIQEFGHYIDLCDSEAAEIMKRNAAWMNQSDIITHLNECRDALQKFKSRTKTPELSDLKLRQIKIVQNAVNLAIERIELGRRGVLGLSPSDIVPYRDLFFLGFSNNGELELEILTALTSLEFLEHGTLLEQHIKFLRDTNASEDVIRDFELDLIRTRQLEDIMLLNSKMGKSSELGRTMVEHLFDMGLIYAGFKSGAHLVDYLRTKASAAFAELKKPAQTSRPASPKKYPKYPADIDFGIPKRLAGFEAAEGSQVNIDIAAPDNMVAPQELERQLQEVREYELRQHELLKQQELRKREQEQHQSEREARERHEIEQDKLACWARAGHLWAKGGRQDLSFYYAAKPYIEDGRLNGKSRQSIIEAQWKAFKEDQQSGSHSKSHASKKLPSKRANPSGAGKTTVEPKQVTQPTRPAAAAVRRNPWDNDNNEPEAQRPAKEIDWSEPILNNDQKQQSRRKSEDSPGRRANTLERAALNEFLFTEGALSWHASIEKRDPIQDEILEDVLWYSGLVLTNAIAENDALSRTALRFGEVDVGEHVLQFTANDRDARVIRAHIAHGFREPGEIERFAREVVVHYLGPRVKRFCDGASSSEDLLVDLSRNELFEERELTLDVNSTIRKQFERLSRYMAYLMAKEQRMAHAFALLNQQNQGNAVFELGAMDYRLVDVFAARAIEAVLVRLGELHHLYLEQAQEEQTLTPEVVAFLHELNQKVRKKAAHEIDENHADWHFSPLSAETVHRLILQAIRLTDALKRA